MLHATKQNNIAILAYLKSPWQLRLELMGFIFDKHVSSFLFVVFLGEFFFSFINHLLSPSRETK